MKQNIIAAANFEECSLKNKSLEFWMELQPAVYDSGDFGSETSNGITNEYVLVKNKNKLVKFVLQIIKTSENIFKNFHFKFLNFFYISIADERVHEPRKDSLELPSRITQLESETLKYLGGSVTMIDG